MRLFCSLKSDFKPNVQVCNDPMIARVWGLHPAVLQSTRALYTSSTHSFIGQHPCNRALYTSSTLSFIGQHPSKRALRTRPEFERVDHVDTTYQEAPAPSLATKPSLDINIKQLIRDIQSKSVTKEGASTEWVEHRLTLRDYPSLYLSLMKSRLTTLVVLTAVAGYGFAPVPGSALTFLALTTGTFLCSGAANTMNQVMEQPFDSQMSRCSARVMVQHKITPLHGVLLGATSAVLGTAILCTINPLTAALGVSTILLYTMVYTTMKRYTIANTWVGSIVGAIPPAMGWASCTGTLYNTEALGALSLCALLYFWQFPHFNALSWNLRADYCRAGYHMTCVTDSALCARVSLRNTIALIPLCIAIPFTGISHCSFSFYSVILNTYFSYLAYNFYRCQNKETARELFRFSLWYLPIVFAFLAVGYTFKARAVEERHHVEGAYVRDLCPVTLPPHAPK